MVGHSMGAHVAARLAADRPDRVRGVVLVDGGLPFFAAPQEWDEEPNDGDPTAGRMESHCHSEEEYLAGWRAHAAFRSAWNEDVEAYDSPGPATVAAAIRGAVLETDRTRRRAQD
jgi:pimeloyl-ACP methyl ester carboxylesterase